MGAELEEGGGTREGKIDRNLILTDPKGGSAKCSESRKKTKSSFPIQAA